MLYYFIVICSVFVAACAQMLLKQGAKQNYASWLRQYLNPWVISGYGIMFVCMIVNIYAMSNGVKLKEASIIESLSYLFVPVLAFILFHERITWRKGIAIAIIMAGVIVFFI